MIDWAAIAKVLHPSSILLLIIIFWLMRQNSQLVSVAFKTHESIERLKGVVEKLVNEIRSLK